MARFLLYSIGYAIQDRQAKEGELRVFESLPDIHWVTHKEDFFDMLDKGWKLCVQLISELVALYCLSFLVANNTIDLDILNVMNQCFLFSIIMPISIGVNGLYLLVQWMHISHPKCLEAIHKDENVKGKVDSFIYGCSAIKNFIFFRKEDLFSAGDTNIPALVCNS